MSFKSFCLVLACIAQAITAIAQNKLDSLRQVVYLSKTNADKAEHLGDLAFELSRSNPDSAMILARQGLSQSISEKTERGQAVNLNALGWIEHLKGRADSSIYFFKQARELYHKLNLGTAEARCLVNMSVVYNQSTDYENALACLFPAKNLLDTGSDLITKGYTDKMIGIIYRQQGDYATALNYLHQALENFRRSGAVLYEADANSSLGVLYLKLGKPDSALLCYRQSLNDVTRMNNASGQGYAYENIGDVYASKAELTHNEKHLDSALYYYRRAQSVFRDLHMDEDQMFETLNVSRVLGRQKQYAEAEPNLLRCWRYFDSTGDIQYAYDAAMELKAVYKDLGQFEKSLRFSDTASVYKDSLDARNRASTMSSMLAKYETEKKDRTIQLLNANEKIDKQKLQRQRVVMGFSVVLLALALVLARVIFNRNRIRQQLQAVNMRNQISADLHDDIGSSLSSILLMSKIGGSNQQPVLDKIGGISREVIDKMDDIVWTMNPKYDEGINLKDKLEKYLLRLEDMTSMQFHVSLDPELEHIRLPMEIRKNVFLIFKEAVNNALKYSGAAHLNTSLKIQQRHLLLEISDDGKGFDPHTQRQGNGMTTLRRRAESVKGRCEIISVCGKGTRVQAEIPIPQNRY